MPERPHTLPTEKRKDQFTKFRTLLRDLFDPVSVVKFPNLHIEHLAGGYRGCIGVISLDSGSGGDFCATIKDELMRKLGINNTVKQINVSNTPPRVIYPEGSTQGVLTPNQLSVARPIAEACLDDLVSGTIRIFTMACNTASAALFVDKIAEELRRLSIEWRRKHIWDPNPQLRWRARRIPREGLSHGSHFMIIDTLSTLRTITPQRPSLHDLVRGWSVEPKTAPRTKYLFMATEALAKEAQASYQFMTPLDERTELPEETQPLIQEIIWRIKLRMGNDVRSVMNVKRADGTIGPLYPNFDPRDSLKKETSLLLLRKIQQLLHILHENGFNKLILACTELPIAFKLANLYGLFPPGYHPLILDMAVITANQIATTLNDGLDTANQPPQGVRHEELGTAGELHPVLNVAFFRRALGLSTNEIQLYVPPQPTPLPIPTPAAPKHV